MANRKGKGGSARTSSAESKASASPPPDKKPASSKAPTLASSKRASRPRSKKRPTSIPPNWFTRKDVAPRGGNLSMKLPTDYVICMRGLAKLHGRTLVDTFRATLWSYLKLTRGEQLKATFLEPALPIHEVKGWGGVGPDGQLYPWAAPHFEKALDVVNDPNEVVRVVIRHLPAEADQRPRGWKE